MRNLFKRKPQRPTIVRPGDVVLLSTGAAYRVDATALVRLPIKRIGEQ